MDQEDAFFPPKGVQSKDVFTVCDGVGGTTGGQVAAQVVSGSFWAEVHRQPSDLDLLKKAHLALKHAHIRLRAISNRLHSDMATTLAAVIFGEKEALAFWIGDTRIYHLRKGKILWRSEDHNLAYHMQKAGVIDEKTARHHASRRILLRSVNAQAISMIPDHHRITDIKKGDHIIISTDGVFESILESDLALLSLDDPKAMEMIEQQCALFSRDNYTLLNILF
jgi:protein phosphatase